MTTRKKPLERLRNTIANMMSAEDVVEKKAQKSPKQQSHDEEIQNAILVLASAVIRCDRNYTSETETQLQKFLGEQFGEQGVQQRMKQVHSHLQAGTEPFIKIACKQLKMLTTDESLLSIVQFLFNVAGADDFVNAKETRCLQRIATYLGVDEKGFAAIKQQFIHHHNPYSILGIDETANWETVRRAYRKMILQTHPDKNAARTTDAEAHAKFREVQHAFELIRKERGREKE
ncbi:MAG: DnaJ domain-containing protein [Bacteroidetes bacterium]|nr:DnaJ domain-containing protein [Bacteroidota bacterium]